MESRTAAVLLAFSLALACAQEEASRNARESAVSDTLGSGAIPYWSDEPLLTQEDIAEDRYDRSWREAASIDSFARADTTGGAIPSAGLLPADSITIPETWDDIEALSGGAASSPATGGKAARTASIHLPLGGQVAGPSVLYVQVLLDRARFSPGVIDGRWGQNVEKAVYWLQRREGLPATGIVDSLTFRRLTELAGEPERYVASVVLTEDDVAGPFVELPERIYDQASLECLCYESLAEKLAEKHHATVELLEHLNAGVALDSLVAGDSLVVPVSWEVAGRNVAAGGGATGDTLAGDGRTGDGRTGDTPSGDAGATAGPIASLIVSDQGEYVHALDAEGRIVFHFPSTLGSSYDPSPEGELTITNVAMDPAFHYQPDLLSGVADTARPVMLSPGPNSPVGLVWIQLSEEHYGIHGTRDPATIGYETSSGCIRLTNWDAVFLAQRIEPGIRVEFTDAAPPAGD